MEGSTKKSNHFLVQGSILAAASIIVRLIGLLYRIPMTRILGDQGMGIYGSAYEVYNVALILSSYSLPLAVSKLVAARATKKEHRNAYRLFLCSMCFAIVVGLFATLIIFFGADFLAVLFYKDPYIALPLKVLAPTIFVFSIMGVLRGYYQGKSTMIPTSISQVLEQIVNAIVSVSAAYLLMINFSISDKVAAYGAAGGTLGTFVGAFVGMLFLFFVFILYKPTIKKQLKRDKTHNHETYSFLLKTLFITIVPVILSQIVYQISGLLDNTLFAHIMSTKQVTHFDQTIVKDVTEGQLYTRDIRATLFGIYSNKYRLLTNLPVAIASAFGAAIVPSIAAAKINDMEDVIRHKVHSAVKFNMIIAIPAAVGMGVLAAPIIKLLFPGTNVLLSANLLRLGSVAIVFFALSTVTNSVLQGINKLKIPVMNSAISLGIHVILLFFLLHFTNLSTYALVIGNVTFAMVVSLLNWFSVAKYLNYKQELIRTFLIPTISAGFMGLATYFGYQGILFISDSNLVATLASIVIAILVYFIFMVFMKGIDEDELQFLPKGYFIIRLLRKLHLL
ncbi:MAG: hypothetical protein K0S47_840 [Herbinix sp.]|jgi:stage V sporulation protein B|nr:hypothetical protein [Herbinix sp.]